MLKREIIQAVQDHKISVTKAMELLGYEPYPADKSATGAIYTEAELGAIVKSAVGNTLQDGKPINLTELKLWVIKERDRLPLTNDRRGYMVDGFMVALCNKIDELTVRPTVEPLAELADRKGMAIWFIDRSCVKGKRGWVVSVANGSDPNEFFGLTYQEAETNARQFLNGLPDREIK